MAKSGEDKLLGTKLHSKLFAMLLQQRRLFPVPDVCSLFPAVAAVPFTYFLLLLPTPREFCSLCRTIAGN